MIEFLKAARLSFKISQNSFRLRLLRELAHEMANELSLQTVTREIENDPVENEIRNQIATLRTYRNTIDHWLKRHPDIDSNIWPLDRALELFEKSTLLIQMGDKIIYGDIQSSQAQSATESSSGIAPARTKA